ncbi:hypothetical protein Tco_0292361 [Tanacetum coccineum]
MDTELVGDSEVRAESREELEQESSKKQKLEEDKEFEELKQCLEIIPDDGDDVTIDATPLSTKSPTIVDYKIYKEGNKSCFQIIRADVKARFKKTGPVNYMDNFLLLNLKTMFEHHVEDNKMYPLTNHTLHQMFNDVKLQVDYECEMEFKLLRLIKKQLKEGYERIVGIKSLLEVTAAKVYVTAAKQNTASVKLALLVKIEENILRKPVLQPHRNQSVVRQPTAFKSERPRISKPRFASQVDVNNDLPKPDTTYYLSKGKESACAKPHHMIAPGSSRYSSNDMVHNHYLEEAKKQTHKISRNSKTSVMPSTRSQSTTNGRKPKPRINNQKSRNWPESKSSCITTKTVPIAEHSRNSRNFSDSKHFVCSTFHKCVFNANHDHCVTKFLNEVNSCAKVPSNKTTNRNKPVEKISVAKKPERQIPKGHMSSIKKTSTVHEKTMTPRSCLRWKPTGNFFKVVGLRWVPTGKIFTSSTTKVDSELTNGSNDDITNQYECEQTLNVSAATLNLSASISFNPKKEGLRVCSELGIHDYSNEPSSSKLVPKVVPPADKTTTSQQEFKLLFSPMSGKSDSYGRIQRIESLWIRCIELYLSVVFDVSKIIMHQFWYTIKKVQGTNSYEFLLANKKCVVNADVFRTILDICPRVEGVDFTDVPDDDVALVFLIKLGYKDVHQYSSSQIPPRKARPKSQRKKTDDDSQEIIDISKESEPEPEPVSQSIKTEAEDAKQKAKKEEQEVADTIQALKESRKTSKRQPGTGGSSEGTGTIPGVLDESLVVSATSSEGTGTKSGVPDEEKDITKENVILEWGSKQESKYSEEDQLNDEQNDDKEGDANDEGDDHISDTKDADNKDDETESDEDEIYKYKICVHKDEDVEMSNADVEDSDKGNEDVTDAPKADAKKTLEVKDDAKKTELPPTSSSLSVSLGFGDQFLKLYSDSSLVSIVKDTTDADINSLLEVKILSEVPHIQFPSMLRVQVSEISKPLVLTPVQESPSIATITTLHPPSVSTTPPIPQQTTTLIPNKQ